MEITKEQINLLKSKRDLIKPKCSFAFHQDEVRNFMGVSSYAALSESDKDAIFEESIQKANHNEKLFDKLSRAIDFAEQQLNLQEMLSIDFNLSGNQ